MKAFLEFIKKSKKLKTNLILSGLFLSLLPARNYYSSLKLSNTNPLVRPVNYQLTTLSDYPLNSTNLKAPYLLAKSAIVIDQTSKAILYQKNPDLKLPPASVTKIMTALVVLDNHDLNQVVTINTLEEIGQTMELEIGEEISVKNLLYGLLVQSGNDAAQVLSDFYPGGTKAFVEAMNQKAKDLNLKDTQFQNPAGLDSYGHYTTVHDLGILAAVAMDNPTFKKIVGTKTITVTDTSNTITHELETINHLLGQVEGVIGVKTGWTELAGECLVTYTKRGPREIITVILGSPDRFGESTQLIDWAFNNHQWSKVPPATH